MEARHLWCVKEYLFYLAVNKIHALGLAQPVLLMRASESPWLCTKF